MTEKKRRSGQDAEFRLLEKGMELFSENGYDATTTRMIAKKCGINVATIAFRYGNKEGFYTAVMECAAKIMETHFRPFYSKVERYLSGNTYEEMTWAMIDEFFDLIISIVRDEKQRAILYLLIREQTNPPGGGYPLTVVICKQSETILLALIKLIDHDADIVTMSVYCRLIIGGLISQSEHPMFMRRLLGLSDDAELGENIWKAEKQFAMTSIWQLVNKDAACPFYQEPEAERATAARRARKKKSGAEE